MRVLTPQKTTGQLLNAASIECLAQKNAALSIYKMHTQKKKKKKGWGGDITIMISCWYKPCDFSYVKVHRYAMPQ